VQCSVWQGSTSRINSSSSSSSRSYSGEGRENAIIDEPWKCRDEENYQNCRTRGEEGVGRCVAGVVRHGMEPHGVWCDIKGCVVSSVVRFLDYVEYN
jgi:hypothetical protein